MRMGGRTMLYIVCAFLFPLGFICFVIGFGSPVWLSVSSDQSSGLWQSCEDDQVKDCTRLNFNDPNDWMIGVRAVEIFALVMYVAAAVNLVYENVNSNFLGRSLLERLALGIITILAGLGGLAGVAVFVGKNDDLVSDTPGLTFGWAMALLAAASALAVIVGVGFFVSGFYFEKKMNQHPPKQLINGRGPHLTSNEENYELAAYSKGGRYYDRGPMGQPNDNLPGFAVYNGMFNQPGQRNSLPLGVTASNSLPPPALNGRSRGGPPPPGKSYQYLSLSDDRLLDPNYDLSNGFVHLPHQGRPSARGHDNPAYTRDPAPHARGGSSYYTRTVQEDPYNRVTRGGPPRAGYNDPYGFDRMPSSRGGGGGGSEAIYDRANYYGRSNYGGQPMRDSYYRKY